MKKSLSDKIIEDRRLKQNPYAHLNEHGTYSAFPSVPPLVLASIDQIRESRLLLKNPYAYLDDGGGYTALTTQTRPHVSAAQVETISLQELNPKLKDHYSDNEIKQLARNLQGRMWHFRHQLWPEIVPSNPIKILDPEVALAAIGYEFELSESLGQFLYKGKQVEVAGTIHRDSKHVRISRQFSPVIRSFTAAHELGHALMHDNNGLHRDRPVDGSSLLSRSSKEIQADKFATYFLMPEKLVKKIFKQLYLADVFSVNEGTAFALGCDYESLRNKSRREISRLLASTERYNGSNFISIADQFHVSHEAMAIRLEELRLLGE